MSSSPRPWIDVLALPEQLHIAVTDGDLDPKVRKMFYDCTTAELSMRAWKRNVTD